MGDEKQVLKDGDTMDVAILSSPQRPYVTPDFSLVSSTSGPNPGIELILLAFQNKYEKQRFSVSANENGVLYMTSGEFVGGQAIADLAVVRFNIKTALEAGQLLLKHLVQNGHATPEDVAAMLRSDGTIP